MKKKIKCFHKSIVFGKQALIVFSEFITHPVTGFSLEEIEERVNPFFVPVVKPLSFLKSHVRTHLVVYNQLMSANVFCCTKGNNKKPRKRLQKICKQNTKKIKRVNKRNGWKNFLSEGEG